MFNDFKAKDLVAIVVIGAMVLFKLTGHNGTLDVAVALIVGYYFARREDTTLTVKKKHVEEIIEHDNKKKK